MSKFTARGLTDADEGTHPTPAGHSGLWGDTFWLSVVDPEANVFGVNHFHMTNKGYGRFTAHYVIDGENQCYGNKHPFELGDGGAQKFSDGRLSYEVIEPFETIKVAFDGPRFGFDLTFTGRFQAFNYDELENDPMKSVGKTAVVHGGHVEQGLAVSGSFDIRHGPAAGETRTIECWGFRDHSWSTRFSEESPWADSTRPDRAAHFWPSIALPNRHITVMGILATRTSGDEDATVGGFIADSNGARPVTIARQEIKSDDLRNQQSFRHIITLDDGETLTVNSTAHYGTIKLWDRGENDLENRFDCYEPFVSFEVEETGERGTGVSEYSVIPPRPRWLI